MRSDWVLPICNGHERLKDAQGDKAHPTQKPESLLHRFCWPRPIPATWCSTRSSAPAPPGRWPRSWAAISSGSSARRPIARWPKSGWRRSGAIDRTSLEVSQSKRAEPRIPFGQLVERGLLRPGEELVSPRGKIAKIRADGTLVVSDTQGLDPPGRGEAGRRAVVQRLDLLAFPPRRQDGADRPVAPAGALGTGGLRARNAAGASRVIARPRDGDPMRGARRFISQHPRNLPALRRRNQIARPGGGLAIARRLRRYSRERIPSRTLSLPAASASCPCHRRANR